MLKLRGVKFESLEDHLSATVLLLVSESNSVEQSERTVAATVLTVMLPTGAELLTLVILSLVWAQTLPSH